MRVIVVGAGIGGLATAIALRRAGLEAAVFERAGELREIGAGISLWANAMKALKKIGLYEAVRSAGRPLRPGGELRSSTGEVYLEVSAAAMEEGFGDVTIALHRADLQEVLLGALEPREAVRLGTDFRGFEQDGEGLVACFADGRAERGDLLVGADGLRSTVRARLLGDGPPRYAGYAAWRGVVELEDDPVPGRAGFEAWGRGGRFGLVKLGRGRAYWFATKNAPEGEEEAAGRKEELLARFGVWHEPIPAVINATGESDIHYDGVYCREPVKRWSEGRVTLLGDAAHPMTPDLGQGACQAIEDAVTLGACLAKVGDVETALKFYEAQRADRTAYVVRRSRRLGRLGQLENPLACGLRDAVLKALPRRLLQSRQLKALEPIAGYEAS